MDERLQEMIEKFRVAVAFAREFEAEFGKEKTHRLLARAFEKLQVAYGKKLAEELGDNSIEALAGFFRKQAAENEYLDVLDVTDERIALKISRCRSLDALTHLGAPEICRLYCDSDEAFIRAFNPKMTLMRTKTLAGGDDCCDHIWAIERC